MSKKSLKITRTSLVRASLNEIVNFGDETRNDKEPNNTPKMNHRLNELVKQLDDISRLLDQLISRY